MISESTVFFACLCGFGWGIALTLIYVISEYGLGIKK